MPRATSLPKPFLYPTKQSRARTEARIPRPRFGAPEAEVLTALVQGKKASAPEERFARSLDKSNQWQGYTFRRKIILPAYVAGSIEVDFWAYNAGGEERAIRIDGDWVHARAEQVKKDKEDRDTLDNYLRARGLAASITIPGHRLETQTMSDQTLSEIA